MDRLKQNCSRMCFIGVMGGMASLPSHRALPFVATAAKSLAPSSLGFRAREGCLSCSDHVVRRAEFFRQRDSVTRVLVHEVEREIRFVEVAFDHARELQPARSGRGGARADERGDLAGCETRFPGEGQRLGQTRRLSCGQHVVDELPGRPRPGRADMVDALADRLQRRTRSLQGFGVAAHEEYEPASGGGGPAAADRRVEETAAPLLRLGRQARAPNRASACSISIKIAPRFAFSSAPEGPSQMSREASSSATIAKIISAPSAASRGVAATVAPCAAKGAVLAGVRVHIVNGKPFFSQFAAMPAPIVPTPRRAMRCILRPQSICVTLRSGRSQLRRRRRAEASSKFRLPARPKRAQANRAFADEDQKPISSLTEPTEVRGFLPCEGGAVDDGSALNSDHSQAACEREKSTNVGVDDEA